MQNDFSRAWQHAPKPGQAADERIGNVRGTTGVQEFSNFGTLPRSPRPR
jgi:hypothetical protein